MYPVDPALTGDRGAETLLTFPLNSYLPWARKPRPYKVVVRVGVRFPDPPAGLEFWSRVMFLATSNPVYFTQPTYQVSQLFSCLNPTATLNQL